MKRFDEYTKEEAAKWTDEDIDRLIEIELMKEGVVSVPCPKAPNIEKIDLSPRVSLYEVKGVLLGTVEDAAILANLKTYKSDYDYGGAGYGFPWATEHKEEQRIITKPFYDEREVRSVRVMAGENERKQKEYDEDKKKYDAFLKATEYSRGDVRKFHREACQWVAKLELAQALLDKYRGLAGDEDTAIKFFRDAYKNEPEVIATVLGEPMPEIKEEA